MREGEVSKAPASNVVTTFCKFNHILALNTLAPVFLCSQRLQQLIFCTGIGMGSFVIIACHIGMPWDLAIDTKIGLTFHASPGSRLFSTHIKAAGIL